MKQDSACEVIRLFLDGVQPTINAAFFYYMPDQIRGTVAVFQEGKPLNMVFGSTQSSTKAVP